jgi:Tfp pilus assembly protein PilZ
MIEGLKVVERRARPRIETKVKVRINTMGDETFTFSGNLSKSGVFFETSDFIGEVGEKVQMEIRLSNSDEDIKVLGKITRIVRPNQVKTAPGYGIEFMRVEARQARTFDRLIDRLLDARGIGCRKYPRVKTQIVIELKSKKDVQKVISDNLSRGGIFLKMEVNGVVLGDTLNIVLWHPTAKRKFMIDGEVVHIRKGESKVDSEFIEGVGVQFLELTSTRRSDMALFLKSVLGAQRRPAK